MEQEQDETHTKRWPAIREAWTAPHPLPPQRRSRMAVRSRYCGIEEEGVSLWTGGDGSALEQ